MSMWRLCRAVSEKTIELDTVAYDTIDKPDRGYSVRATYLKVPKGDALIEIFRDGIKVRDFLYPSYKIYNIAAHFNEIVDGEIEGHDGGYRAASWNGISSRTLWKESAKRPSRMV